MQPPQCFHLQEEKKLGWLSVMTVNTVEPLYCGHIGDLVKCPV